MSKHNLIIRNTFDQHKRLKFTRNKPTVSKNPETSTKHYKPIRPVSAVKEDNNNPNLSKRQILGNVNGNWNKMHNIQTDQIQFHNTYTSLNLNDCRNFLNPSPRGSDSGIESDCTDGNLSWLLNYKIHELPPVPDVNNVENGLYFDSDIQSNYNQPQDDTSRLNTTKPNNNILKDNGNIKSHSRYSGPKKPPFTYTELIEHALNEKGELTVSGIYQWISEHFPFYKQNDDRWKNSVRHNLSINPHFRKGSKAVRGAGHLWTIAQKDDRKSWQIKQRVEQFIQTQEDEKNEEQDALDIELQAATASILGDCLELYKEQDIDALEKKQKIEVEFINVIDVNHDGLEDFLSPPVSKQELVQECGLGNDFLITDINPNSLGLNLAEAEVITDGTFYENIALEYYDLEKE